MRVGFIGLGRMGSRMAANLLKHGFELTVHNRTRSACEPLERAGAGVAKSPRALGEACEVVITMVADRAAAEAVLLGEEGALGGMTTGSAIIEMSTIGPAGVRSIESAAGQRGIKVLDAPVSGSIGLAESGELTTMVGGDREVFERLRPLLQAMTRQQFYLGPSGSGAAMKLAINGVIAVTNQVVAEALVLAERSGIERPRAYEVLAGSAVASPFVKYKQAAFLDPASQAVSFTTTLLQKDLNLASDLAQELGVPIPTMATANEGLTAARGLGHGESDIVAVAEVLRTLAGNRERVD